MISPNLLQAAIVARLQANAVLIAALPDGANGVKEAEWHGTGFNYPAVRVDRPRLEPQPNGGHCIDQVSNATIDVAIISKRESSRPASVIMGMVEDALAGGTIVTAALRSTALHPLLVSPVEPSPQYENVWQGRVTIGTMVTAL